MTYNVHVRHIEKWEMVCSDDNEEYKNKKLWNKIREEIEVGNKS